MSSGMISVYPGMLPAMKITDPYSPMARAKASVKPVRTAGAAAAGRPAEGSCKRLAPRSRRRLLVLPLALPQHRLDGPHDEGQADEDERDQDAERREGDAEAEARTGAARSSPSSRSSEVRAMPATAVGSAKGRSISASTKRRPGKPVAHQHPRDENTEDGIDERGDERGSEADAERRERARVRKLGPELRPADAGRLDEEHQQRDQHDEREIAEREAEGEAETR